MSNITDLKYILMLMLIF